jgi:hypothetical protein
MKNIKFISLTFSVLLGFIFIINSSCERSLSGDVEFATFPNGGDIFTDSPVGLGSDFYFPFAGDASNPIGSKFDAFSVDESESYQGTASMRIDVPNANDPNGNYAGAIFRIDGTGRNLTNYDALTFWAKASQGAIISEIGFGEDFGESKYKAVASNLLFSTNWVKFTIPIPDPSKLTNERGMLFYSVGAPSTGLGFTFWIDELKFEKLGTVAQPQPTIFGGEDVVQGSFIGSSIIMSGLTQTFNLASGLNQTVNSAPSYFIFTSSNTDVAIVNELGVVSVIGSGTSEITATLGGVRAAGTLNIESAGAFTTAPVPTRDPSDVISIFSDTYTNVPVDFFNGFWEPFQLTESSDFVADGNNMISYTNFNFVGNQFANPTVNATEFPNLHLDMYIPGDIPADLDFLITIVDFGADAAEGGGDDTREQVFFYASDFIGDAWSTLEIPISLVNKNNIGLIIYENINNPTTSSIDDFYLDNIYFYRN